MDTSIPQAFIIAGTVPFILLGFAHGVYTWIERSRPFRLSPRNPEVRAAMMETELKIYPGTNVWRGWIGFNFSHSLGAVVFGVLYATLANDAFDVILNNAVLLWLPVVFSGAFVVLAWRYWFVYPLIGTGMGFASFVVGVGLASLG